MNHSGNPPARLGDRTRHSHNATASKNVAVGRKRVVRTGDTTQNKTVAKKGAPAVLVNSKQVHRVGDQHEDTTTLTGAVRTLIGDVMKAVDPPSFGMIVELRCAHALRNVKAPLVLHVVPTEKPSSGQGPTISAAPDSGGAPEPAERFPPEGTLVDHIALKLVKYPSPLPKEVQIYSHGTFISTARIHGSSCHFDVWCREEDNLPLFKGYYRGTRYDVKGVVLEGRVTAYCPSKWEFKFKSPPFFSWKDKTGTPLKADTLEERRKLQGTRDHVKKIESTSWRPWKRVETETTQTVQRFTKDSARRIDRDEVKRETGNSGSEFLTIKRDGRELKLDTRVLHAMKNLEEGCNAVERWYKAVKGAFPKPGFFTDISFSWLIGEIEGQLEWKEHTDHRAWLRVALAGRVNFVELDLKFCFGIDCWLGRADVFLELQGSVGMEVNSETTGPDSEKMDFSVVGTISGTLGLEGSLYSLVDVKMDASIGIKIRVVTNLTEHSGWTGEIRLISPKARVTMSTRSGVELGAEVDIGEHVESLKDNKLLWSW